MSARYAPAVVGDTLDEVLTAVAAAPGGMTFLGSGELPFAELDARTAELAGHWAGLGVRAGDRVVLVLPDPVEFILALMSAARAGVLAVPFFPPLTLAQRDPYIETLQSVCRTAGARLCLGSEAVLGLIGSGQLPCATDSFDALLAATPGPVARPAPGDPVLLQFTSGTTSAPKGVLVTNRALMDHARALGAAMDIHGEVDRGVSWLPLYHDMGLIGKVFAAVLTRTSTWHIPPTKFVRDPAGFLRLLTEVRGTISFAPNFAYGLMARRAVLDGLDLSSWRLAGCGAEPVHAPTLRRFAEVYRAVGFRPGAFAPCYGLAEATLAVCVTRPGDGVGSITVDAERLGTDGRAELRTPGTAGTTELVSCGRPIPGTEVRIVDQQGNEVADGTDGEIVLRSSYYGAEYYGNAGATAATWRDGWLHTGDSGLRRDGQLYVTGRLKDLIIVNGRNYQPQDIERVVDLVDNVRPNNVVALGVRSGDGEAVHLVVEAVRHKESAGLADRIGEAVRRRFPVPVAGVTVVRSGTLPRTSSGKVRRRRTATLLSEGKLAALTEAQRTVEGTTTS